MEDPSEAEVGQVEAQTGALLQKAAQDGQVGVIVVLRTAGGPDSGQAGAFAGMQDALARSMTGYNLQTTYRYQNFPMLAAQVDERALNALLRNPLVADVQEDGISYPTLLESTTVIGAVESFQAGFSGQGVTLAVIDTGVDRNHPFLAGRVVAEACFSGGGGQADVLCPNGLSEQVGTGAGVACEGFDGCDHGTHVAGIATGAGANYSGVAREASIIAVNVFSWSPANGLVTYDSDYIKGLDFVYSLRNDYTIAAVNMSLGGGQFTRYCDRVNAASKRAIDRLRAVNIATVIASGNNGFTSSMSSPACISTAVSVGSTTKTDGVSDFSNYASFLSLLAPGSAINSSVPGGGFESKDGTSMATPHVAGAWAVLREALPTKNVAAIVSLLKSTGVPVRDARNNKVKPRINLANALGKFRKPQVAPALISPADGAQLNSSTVELTWERLPLVSKYKVVVKRGSATVYNKTLAASAVCPLGGEECSTIVPVILRTAMHTWTVQPFSGAGGGPASLARSFNTPTGVPGAINLTFPTGGIGYYSPAFQWSEVAPPFAARYNLHIYLNGRRVLNKTYDAHKICASGECSVPRPLVLKEGDYTWEVLPSNPVGFGATAAAAFDFHLANGFDNHFDVDHAGVTLLYPQPDWWWVEGSNLQTEYGKNFSFASARIDALYTNVDLSAVMYREGDLYSSNGIILRGTPTLSGRSKDWKSGYAFFYANDGYFSVWKIYNFRSYALQDWVQSPAINQGGTNLLRAVAEGTDLSFYINGSLVWSGVDMATGPDLVRGSAGFMSYVPDWFETFDYLAVDRLTASDPTLPGALDAERISDEQLALNEAANANPTGSVYSRQVSAEMAERMQTAPGQVESTLAEKMQACLAAGDRCALPFPH